MALFVHQTVDIILNRFRNSMNINSVLYFDGYLNSFQENLEKLIVPVRLIHVLMKLKKKCLKKTKPTAIRKKKQRKTKNKMQKVY